MQFARPSDLTDAATIRECGGTPLATVPANAWLCRLDRSALGVLGARRDVAHIEHLAPWRRLAPVLRQPFSQLPVRVRLASDADPARALMRWARMGMKHDPLAPMAERIPALRVTPSQLAALARDPDVIAIDLDGGLQPLMDVVRSSSNIPTARGAIDGPMLDAERAWDMGLRGDGQVIAIADTGLDTGTFTDSGGRPHLHDDFGRQGDLVNPSRVRAVFPPSALQPGLPSTWDDRWDHGTSVAAVALGNGALSGSTPSSDLYSTSHAGIAPKAQLVVECIAYTDGAGNSGSTLGRSVSDDLMGLAERVGASVHSTSMGGSPDSSYGWTSAEWDEAAWDHPQMTLLVGAGNWGNDGLVLPWEGAWDAGGCAPGWTLDDTLQPDALGGCMLTTQGFPFWTINDRACELPYLPSMDACLVSPALAVDPSRPPVRLTLLHEADLTADADVGLVELDADDDGVFETNLLRVVGRVALGSEQVALPAAPWGLSARLRFRFVSDGTGESMGWNIHLFQLGDGVMDAYSLSSPGTAKNVITVGASENVRPSARDDVAARGDCADLGLWTGEAEPVGSDHRADDGRGMAAFSSRGPALDGRIKPDIVAPGTFVLTARSRMGSSLSGCGIAATEMDDYRWFGGTSAAAPIVAGAAAIVRQSLVEGRHRNHSLLPLGAPAASRGFEPSGALVKAILLSSAFDMGRGQYPPPHEEIPAMSPNPVSGHGRVDVMSALDPALAFGADPRLRRLIADERVGLSTGAFRDHPFRVVSADVPLKITLAWTDPPASAAASVTLVNDLDVSIQLSDGSVLALGDDPFGNVNGGTLAAGTFPSGPAIVTIRGARVPGQFGHPGSDVQPYALVIAGHITCPAPAEVGGTLRVAANAAAGDVLLTWDAPPGAVSFLVMDADELTQFVSRTDLGSPASSAFRHEGVLRDGALRCYLVAARNECGELSGP